MDNKSYHLYTDEEKLEIVKDHIDNRIQDDVDLLFSNINSYPRKSLQNKTPYQSVLNDPRLGKEFLDIINISKVNGDDVILNPSLLKKIKK